MKRHLRIFGLLVLLLCMCGSALGAQGFHVYVDGVQADAQSITVCESSCTVSWSDPGFKALYEIRVHDSEGRLIQRYSKVDANAFTMKSSSPDELESYEVRIGAYAADGSSREWVYVKIEFDPVSGPEAELPPDPARTPYILFRNTVRVRTDAGTDYASIGKVSENKSMNWLGEVRTDRHGLPWYNFRYDGRVAWVSSQYSMLWDGASPTDNASLCGDAIRSISMNASMEMYTATPRQELALRAAPGYHSVPYFTLSAADAIMVCEYEACDGKNWVLGEFYHQGKCYRAYTELDRVDAGGQLPRAEQRQIGKTIFTLAKANVVTSPYGNGAVNGKVGRGERVQLLGFENGQAFIQFYNIAEDGWCRGYVPRNVVL